MTKLIKTSNFDKVLKGTKLNKEKYEKLYKESIENNDEFWDKVAKRIDWKKSYEKVKEVNYNDNISIKWFLKGELNICYNCVDRHLQTKGDKIAIIWEGDDPKDSKKIINNLETPLKAISLMTETSFSTAFANDLS